MPRYEATCEHCGDDFNAYRGPNQPAPRFCSYACYWASRENARNSPFVVGRNGPRTDRARVYIGRNEEGKPRYMQRSHWVWNQHHPDDPVRPGDHVHHVDRDHTNDAPDNLVKMPGSDHSRFHNRDHSPEQRAAWMRAYHAANPGKQRKGQPRTCPVCGIEFYRPPSNPSITCSSKCAGKRVSMLHRQQRE